MHRFPFALLPAFALCLLLAGCGQRGPLYIPDEEPPARTPPASDPKAETQSSTETQADAPQSPPDPR